MTVPALFFAAISCLLAVPLIHRQQFRNWLAYVAALGAAAWAQPLAMVVGVAHLAWAMWVGGLSGALGALQILLALFCVAAVSGLWFLGRV
jgi:hypothetical protein